MNKEHLFVGLMATIQIELADLQAKCSIIQNNTPIFTSLKFVIYQGVPTIEIQFDVPNDILGATYWGIDISAIETGWNLSGYVYRNRDEMVYSVDKILTGNLDEYRDMVIEIIRTLDSEITKFL